jgi:hypothetical protein
MMHVPPQRNVSMVSVVVLHCNVAQLHAHLVYNVQVVVIARAALVNLVIADVRNIHHPLFFFWSRNFVGGQFGVHTIDILFVSDGRYHSNG